MYLGLSLTCSKIWPTYSPTTPWITMIKPPKREVRIIWLAHPEIGSPVNTTKKAQTAEAMASVEIINPDIMIKRRKRVD